MRMPSDPGWHDDPEGRRRWWDGKRWGAYAPWDDDAGDDGATRDDARPHDASGARPAHPQLPRLDPSLTFDPTATGRAARATGASAPGTTPSSAARPHDAAGSRRTARPSGAPIGTNTRMAVAYALVVPLGLLGAHRFYLGRIRSATAQLMLSFAAVAAVVVLVGDPSALVLAAAPIAALGWWIADLFRTAGMVHASARRAALRPGAPGYDRGWPGR